MWTRLLKRTGRERRRRSGWRLNDQRSWAVMTACCGVILGAGLGYTGMTDGSGLGANAMKCVLAAVIAVGAAWASARLWKSGRTDEDEDPDEG